MGYVYLIVALVVNALANVILKMHAQQTKDVASANMIAWMQNHWLLFIAIALFAGNVFAYNNALSRLPLSLAYPIMVGGGLLVITLISLMYFKEPIQLKEYAGMVLILIGIVLISQRTATTA